MYRVALSLSLAGSLSDGATLTSSLLLYHDRRHRLVDNRPKKAAAAAAAAAAEEEASVRALPSNYLRRC